MGAITIFDSPIRFFQARLARPPRWDVAMTPVIAHAVLTAITGVIVTERLQFALGSVFERAGGNAGTSSTLHVLGVAASLAGSAIVFWTFSFAAILMHLLSARSGRPERLVEFTALSYVVLLPWDVVKLVAQAAWLEGEPVAVAPAMTALDISHFVQSYQAAFRSTPLQLTVQLVDGFFLLWVVALLGCVLRVVSGLTMVRTVAFSLVAGSVLVVVPWAVQRFG